MKILTQQKFQLAKVLFSAMLMVLVSSCSKDEDNTIADNDNQTQIEDDLSGTNWKLETRYFIYLNESNESVEKTCIYTGTYLKFQSDGYAKYSQQKGVYEECTTEIDGAQEPNLSSTSENDEDYTETCTWNLSDDKKKLTLYNFDIDGDFEVIESSANVLKIRYNENYPENYIEYLLTK